MSDLVVGGAWGDGPPFADHHLLPARRVDRLVEDDVMLAAVFEQTGDGVLRLLTLQREGRRALTAREFLAGRRIEPGARFLPSRLTS